MIEACRTPKLGTGGVVGGVAAAAQPVLMRGPESLVTPEQVQALRGALEQAQPIVMKAQVRYHVDPSAFRFSDDTLDSFRRTLQATEDRLFTLSYE